MSEMTPERIAAMQKVCENARLLTKKHPYVANEIETSLPSLREALAELAALDAPKDRGARAAVEMVIVSDIHHTVVIRDEKGYFTVPILNNGSAHDCARSIRRMIADAINAERADAEAKGRREMWQQYHDRMWNSYPKSMNDESNHMRIICDELNPDKPATERQ